MTMRKYDYFYKAYTIKCEISADGIAECQVIDGLSVLARFKGSEKVVCEAAESFVDKQPDVSEYEA